MSTSNNQNLTEMIVELSVNQQSTSYEPAHWLQKDKYKWLPHTHSGWLDFPHRVHGLSSTSVSSSSFSPRFSA